jgi:hypothetical protein
MGPTSGSHQWGGARWYKKVVNLTPFCPPLVERIRAACRSASRNFRGQGTPPRRAKKQHFDDCESSVDALTARCGHFGCRGIPIAFEKEGTQQKSCKNKFGSKFLLTKRDLGRADC